MTKKYAIVLIPFLLLGLAGAMPAGGEKELIIRLQGEVLVLQRQVRDLQESFDRSQGLTTPLVQKISDNSESSLRALNLLEEALKTSQTTQSNNLSGTNSRIARLTDQVTTNEQRTGQILSQLAQIKTLMDQQKRCMDLQNQAEANPHFDNPEQLYAFAYGHYIKGNYDQAITWFKSYIDGYGSTEAADNALFWIAESYFNQNHFEDALQAYNRILADYSNGDKLAGASLKKGITLLRLERREEGVAALRQVVSGFPGSQEAAAATDQLTALGESFQPTATTPAPVRKNTRRSRP